MGKRPSIASKMPVFIGFEDLTTQHGLYETYTRHAKWYYLWAKYWSIRRFKYGF